MALDGECAPSPWDWVRQQVDTYGATGGAEANDLMGKPIPVVLLEPVDGSR
jgi:hypothetical protein